jgi:hypothetical protein
MLRMSCALLRQAECSVNRRRCTANAADTPRACFLFTQQSVKRHITFSTARVAASELASCAPAGLAFLSVVPLRAAGARGGQRSPELAAPLCSQQRQRKGARENRQRSARSAEERQRDGAPQPRTSVCARCSASVALDLLPRWSGAVGCRAARRFIARWHRTGGGEAPVVRGQPRVTRSCR